MHPQRRNARVVLLAGVVASACTEQVQPTAPGSNGMSAAVAAAAGVKANPKVKVKTMQLGSNTLRIGGPSVPGNVSIGNSGLAIPGGVVVRAEITQGAVSQEAVNTPVQCSSAPGDAGKLPTGTCDMTFSASMSGSPVGGASLAPGAAVFTLHVVQTSDEGDAELASKSLDVNLLATPSMAVSIAPTTLTIGGAAATATAVIQNPANSLQGVALQGWIVQGQTRRATGGTLVTCGSSPGVLTPGTCTMTMSVAASNAGATTGLLVAGPAAFELDLFQSTGGTNTALDVQTVPITLEADAPARIVGIIITPTTALGSTTSYSTVLQNTGPVLHNVKLRSWLSQETARRTAGEFTIQCPGLPPGDLPTGGCTVNGYLVAMNAPNEGYGTLLPGAATFELHLDQVDGETTTLHTKSFPMTLDMSGPRIIGIELPTLTILIGESIEYTATIYNPTSETISLAGIQGYLSQGAIVDFGAGGTELTCAGQATLPPGLCQVSFTLNTRNLFETPNWSPGAATFRLELTAGDTLLDAKYMVVYLYQLQ